MHTDKLSVSISVLLLTINVFSCLRLPTSFSARRGPALYFPPFISRPPCVHARDGGHNCPHIMSSNTFFFHSYYFSCILPHAFIPRFIPQSIFLQQLSIFIMVMGYHCHSSLQFISGIKFKFLRRPRVV